MRTTDQPDRSLPDHQVALELRPKRYTAPGGNISLGVGATSHPMKMQVRKSTLQRARRK